MDAGSEDSKAMPQTSVLWQKLADLSPFTSVHYAHSFNFDNKEKRKNHTYLYIIPAKTPLYRKNLNLNLLERYPGENKIQFRN
jgi:hypothetical protein